MCSRESAIVPVRTGGRGGPTFPEVHVAWQRAQPGMDSRAPGSPLEMRVDLYPWFQWRATFGSSAVRDELSGNGCLIGS